MSAINPYLPSEEAIVKSSPEVLGIERQRKLADLLTSQAFTQPQGQMVSGHYVAPSWTQQLNPMANILAGNAISERADVKQQQLVDALRTQGSAAAQDVLETAKTDKNLALQKALKYQQFPQVQAILPQLSKTTLLEPTTLEREYQAAINDPTKPFKGSINDYKNQMSDADKARIAQGWASHNLAMARFADEVGGGAYGPKPAQPTINQGSPILAQPGVSLAPNAPAYAQGSVTMPPKTDTGYAAVQNFNNSLTPPPGLPPKAQREWYTKSNEPLTGEPAKQVTGAINTIAAIDNYRKILSDYSKLSSLSPDQRANLEAAYNTMALQSKEANALGVLNGQDYNIIKSLAPNPNDMRTLLVSNKVLNEQAAKQRDFMGNIVVNAYGVHQKRIPDYVANKIKPLEDITTTKTQSGDIQRPSNVDENTWKFMTPQEKALFRK